MVNVYEIPASDVDEYMCPCGNHANRSGFYPCDANGVEMEPTIESDWSGLYVCMKCGRLSRIVG